MTQASVSEGDVLDIAVDHGADWALVRLQGHLGIDSSPDLRDRLLAILRGQTAKTITVDLTQVSYIGASGIATLLEALKIARHHQSTLCLKGLQGRTARFFEVTGLMSVFEIPGCKDPSPELR